MRKKLIYSFLIVLIIGISFIGLFSLQLTRGFYITGIEDKLISNGKLISNMFVETYKSENSNYDNIARKFSNILNARVTIIAADGEVIGESDTSSYGMDNHETRPEVMEALAGNIGKSQRYSNTEKFQMLYIAVPIASTNIPKTIIRLAVPLGDIQKIEYTFFKYIALAIVIGFLISSVIAYYLVRNIIKPINEMTSISSKIAGGSYDRRIVLKSRDEVGQLAETFNNMAEKLQITINDLYDKKNKLEAILKSMQNGVIAVDRCGKIILVNPTAINMFGFDADIVGKHILEAIRNFELEDIIIKHQDENREIVVNYPKKRVLRVKAAPIIDNDKTHKNLGVVVVMQDITEIKQLEKIRTDFVANVSHELKTPLTSIKGFTETLKNGAINDVITREKFLDIISVEADRLTRLINDILIISELENKRQSILFERININHALEEIEDMMSGLAKFKNIILTFNKGKDIPDIQGNYDKVKQLLINLIDNAIKYTHSGGEVSVKIYYNNEMVNIEVADTGIGISKEHISRLFERFYRVDKGRSRAMGGTGLGLAIVKHIVATMNGQIKVNSEIGKGTTFTVILPKA